MHALTPATMPTLPFSPPPSETTGSLAKTGSKPSAQRDVAGGLQPGRALRAGHEGRRVEKGAAEPGNSCCHLREAPGDVERDCFDADPGGLPQWAGRRVSTAARGERRVWQRWRELGKVVLWQKSTLVVVVVFVLTGVGLRKGIRFVCVAIQRHVLACGLCPYHVCRENKPRGGGLGGLHGGVLNVDAAYTPIMVLSFG